MASETELHDQSSKSNTKKSHRGSYKHGKNFKGPLENRGCTDVICAVLFVIFLLAFIGVGVWAYIQGDPHALVYPQDSDGNICGYRNMRDKPYLFFFDLTACFRLSPETLFTGAKCFTPQICVKECPKEYWTAYSPTAKRSEMLCKNGINPTQTSKSIRRLAEDEDCAAYYLKSDDEFNRCVPALFSEALQTGGNILSSAGDVLKGKDGKEINGTELAEDKDESMVALSLLLLAKQLGMKVLHDIERVWPMILVGFGMGMVLSFIWIVLMRCIAAPMVWITLLLFLALFGFGAGWSFYKYYTLTQDETANSDFKLTTDLDYYYHNKNTWLAVGIIAAVFFLIVLIVVIFLRTRIRIAIDMIHQTSKAVGMMTSTLFWPILPFVLHVIVIAFYIASAIYLAAAGRDINIETINATTKGDIKSSVRNVLMEIPCDTNDTSTAGKICKFVKFGGDEYIIFLQAFQLFMWFWMMNFVSALGLMTLAGAFASYYWAFKKPEDIPSYPLTNSFGRAIRYHLGSLAFGSLIIAIVQIIRWILEYFDHKFKASENPVAKFCLKCCMCCFWCLEKFLKFLNKNAYIMIAIYGNNFCSSAKEAFSLLLRNFIRVFVVDKVVDFLVFVGKLMVVGAIAVLAFYFFTGQIPVINKLIPAPKLNYYMIPVLIICVGNYVIATAFFSVYDMGVDTIFLCFLKDEEENDGSTAHPYFMSKNLRKILNKKNEQEPPREEEEDNMV